MTTSRKIVAALILPFAAMGIAHALEAQDALGKKALAGDYQAQRNLAYSYVSPRNGEMLNPVMGCAWYLTILNSGSPKVNQGDAGNVEVYCNKLDAPSLGAAKQQARRLLSEISKK
ncbi:hypothetical protein [Herbaspirillum lusitanum]|uniref:hypothetical protein n=1 Tax=Herbaspirillum lusitanum TaxID=213312 RepID=UPI002238B562|nr:hypothetical protein [Herbaspirillum lusitanum]